MYPPVCAIRLIEPMRKLCLFAGLLCSLSQISFSADGGDLWHEMNEKDPVTDSKKIYMYRIADHEILSLGNLFNKMWPRLLVGCENKRSFFAFQLSKSPVTSTGNWVSATTRFGSFKPQTSNWEWRAGGSILLMPDRSDPINFAAALTLADKLYVRYASKEGPEVTLEFSLTGVKNHLPNIAQACGWDYAKALREVQ